MANRRGMTFLETVAAVVIIGMLAAAVTSAISFVAGVQRQQQRQLEAAEVAHRLILQYIDDPKEMPPPTQPIGPLNGDAFRYEFDEQPVEVVSAVDISALPTPGASGSNASPTPPRASGVSLDRISVIRIRVWLAEGSGGASTYQPDLPGATLTRLFDPMASITRPDTGQKIIKDQDRLSDLMKKMGGGGRSGGRGGTR